MSRMQNPYRPQSKIAKLYDGDWRNNSLEQIAEQLDTPVSTVQTYIGKIRRDMGYEIEYAKPQKVIEFETITRRVQEKNQQKRKAAMPVVPLNKCSSCGNRSCRAVYQAVCWTRCGRWEPEVENDECLHE